MLYGCGLRISEAVNLRNEDVNLNEGILRINNSKFDKSRLVPMADSLTIICRSLHNRLHLYSKATQYFFTNKDGSHVSADLVYRRFRDVLWESGIPHGGRRKGPRLHDLDIHLQSIPLKCKQIRALISIVPYRFCQHISGIVL
jgi:integrase/recombinase XerD